MTSDDRKTSKASGARRSAMDKVQLLLRASQLSGEELGAFLRQEGIRDSDLASWKAAIEAGLGGSAKHRSEQRRSPEERRIRELEQELLRKDKALAEVTALLALKKKIQEIWGDEADDTRRRNEP